MTLETSIEYQPIFSHAVVKAAALMLIMVTLLDLFMFVTTYVRYDYFSPIGFHVAPLLLLMLLVTKIRLSRINNVFKYQIFMFGVPVITRKFEEVMRLPCGKFVTLVGHAKGRVNRTYITESAETAHAMFCSFLLQKS